MKIWIVFVIVIVGCTTVPDRDKEHLYGEYLEFQELVKDNHELARETKVSDEFLAFNDTAQENMPEELRTPFLENLATKVRLEHSYFEEVQGSEGCLTINGLNKADIPITLSLYYKVEEGNWVIDYFLLHIHNSINNYYYEAKCPDRR